MQNTKIDYNYYKNKQEYFKENKSKNYTMKQYVLMLLYLMFVQTLLSKFFLLF